MTIEVVSNAIVRNLQKRAFFLRIPADRDRPGRVIQIGPSRDAVLDYLDFELVRDEMIRFDRRNILRIIQFPNFAPAGAGVTPNLVQHVLQPLPPEDRSRIWINPATNDSFVYDISTGYWRSSNPVVVPFMRTPSQGAPLIPYGGSTASFPLYVNSSQNRTYQVYRLHCFISDRLAGQAQHGITITSPRYADEEFFLTDSETLQFSPALRVLLPGESLQIRHSSDLAAFYVNITAELCQVVA